MAPATPRDLIALKDTLDLSVQEMLTVLGLTLNEWSAYRRDAASSDTADRPIGDATLRILVDWYGRRPELSPLQPAPHPLVVFEPLKTFDPTLRLGDFAVLLGRHASAASRWKRGRPGSGASRKVEAACRFLERALENSEVVQEVLRTTTSSGVEAGEAGAIPARRAKKR